MISKERLEEELPALGWTSNVTIHGDAWEEEVAAVVELPSYFPEESSCKIVVEFGSKLPKVWYRIQYKGESSFFLLS